MKQRSMGGNFASRYLRRFVTLAALGAAAVAAPLYAVDEADWFGRAPMNRAEAILLDANGTFVGVVEFRQQRGSVQVTASFDNLPPGFHGFHVHTVGMCTAPFTSAGGHFNPAGANHPNHAGDMPTLLAGPDGRADLTLETERYSLDDLFDADGSAVIVHANADNYANIPTDRYAPPPDAATLGTGDAGARIACGVIRRVGRR